MSYYLRFRDYKKLFTKVINRLNSEEDYRSFQEFQGELLIRFLKSRDVFLGDGVSIADVACGYGGYSIALRKTGARVVAVDRFNQISNQSFAFIMGDALTIPISKASFDVVICASLIEHVVAPKRLLDELYRIVKPDGVVYLSFPPFFSPYGGHQFSPFHYLGLERAVKISNFLGPLRKYKWIEDNYPVTPSSSDAAYGDWGLYPLTIAKFEALLRQMPFIVKERSTRMSPMDFTKIPFLREILTWHVQYLLVKAR